MEEKRDILKTIETYNSYRIQREKEAIILSKFQNNIANEFYVKRTNLEVFFTKFTEYRRKPNTFAKYYNANKTSYLNALEEYKTVIIKLKEAISEIPENSLFCENLEITNKTEALETKAHINSVKTGINDNIKDLIIKPVPNCPGYSFGKYGNFDVIFRDKDGFINASKLCKLGGKRYKDWNTSYRNSEGPQQLINALKLKLFEEYKSNIGKDMQNMSGSQLCPTHNSNTNNQNITSFEDIIVEDNLGKKGIIEVIQGTYVHPKLIPAIASWVSPVFALKVADIVEEYFVKKANKKLSSLIKDFQNQLVLKDDKIDTLIKETKKQTQIIIEQTNKIDNLTQVNLKQSEDIKTLLSYGKEARNALVNIDSNIEEIHSKSIEPCKASIETELVLLYNNTGNDNGVVKTKNENGLISVLYPFTFIRRQRKSINNTVKKHILIYPKAEVVFKRTIINAVTALNNIKQDLIKSKNNKKITFTNNHIILNIGYSKESFLEDIDNITSKYIPPLTRVENETGKFI